MILSLYMSTAIQDPKANPKTKITNRQKAFAENYAMPDSDTYLNATQSVIASGHTSNPKSAAVIGSKALRNDNVLSYIEQINDSNGNSIEERSKLVADVLAGVHRNTTKTTHMDADGNPRGTTLVEKSLSPTEIARLVDLTNRAEGLYNKANVAEHVAKREYDERIAAMREEMKGVIASHRARGEGDEGSPT